MKDNQPLEYARMLEIPVSTCQVTVKKSKKRKKKIALGDELKQQVVDSVNARLAAAPACTQDEALEGESQALPEEQAAELLPAVMEEQSALEQAEPADGGESAEMPLFDEPFAEVTVTQRQKRGVFGFFHRRRRPKQPFNVIMAQFFVAAGLVAIIFLTNVFMPGSGINRVIRAAFSGGGAVAADTREYTEFTAASPYRAGDVALEEGVMTFSGKGSLYAPCDGIITRIVDEAGKKTLEIEHSKKFRTVLSGVDYAYYDVGDSVYGALPVGYVGGGTVTVSMYNDGVLLQNYLIDGGVVVWQS